MREINLKMAELNKKFKAEIINMGTDIIEVDKIPFSSPMANYMTYGGIPVGKITELFGGEGGGKTTSALDICGNAQKKFNQVFESKCHSLEKEINELRQSSSKEKQKKADKLKQELDDIIDKGPRLVAYVDTEQTLDTRWAELLGVDTDNMLLVRPQEQTAEQVLQIIIEIIATGDVGLVVLDSIPCLVPQSIFTEDMEKKSYGGISQPLTVFCSKVIPYLVQNQCAFIGINQIREDLSSMYNTISTPGGKGWKHACSLRLRFRKDSYLDSKNNELSSKAENPAGNKVAIEIVKTKVCKPDRRLGYYTLNYTSGIDVINDTITLGIQYDIVRKGGSWYTFANEDGSAMTDEEGNVIKLQGMGNVNEYFRNHEDVFNHIQDMINTKMYSNE